MRIELKFGLITVIAGVAWVMIEHLAGLNSTQFERGEIARMLFAFMPFILVFAGMSAKKKQTHHFSFLAAWRTGTAISLIYSIGFAIWFWLYATFINKEFLQKAVAWENTKLVKQGLSGEALETAMAANTRMYGGSPFSYAMLFVSFFVMGVVVSAILALILKSRKERG